ncbi:MAG: acyl-CoA thioesterase II [Gammaproteobacteria bacterium]|nr:acyl-CoA thioesterase II [Gammaproteobacteria bacterium]MYD79019.1 acyl-CoA thioesterase II [Gammaproteobacteria bacterium]
MTLSSFDSLLDLRENGDDNYTAPASPDKGLRMFGGQFLAQAMEAGVRTVGPGRSIHSLHGYFLRPGNTMLNVDYDVERIRDGRSFSHRRVVASQEGKEMFAMFASWSIPLSSPNYSGRSMPQVPSASASDYSYLQFCRDQMPDPEYETTVQSRPMDIRYINPPQDRTPQSRTEDQLMWMRVSIPVGNRTSLHHAALAYLSDSTLIDHILIPHGKRWQDSDFEGTSLDHAMWFHCDCDATAWHLFEQSVEWTGDGRGLATGRIFTESGKLVATCAQEGLMRFDYS